MARTSNRRDKYPQFFCGRVTESAANTFTTVSINIPTNLLMQKGGMRTIIEVLRVEYSWSNDDGASGSGQFGSFTIGSTPTALIVPNDPRNFSWYQSNIILTTSGLRTLEYPWVHNLTSMDGYGHLIAGDRFHISIQGVSQTNALALDWRIFYREVGVSVMEYVGIVQQQSQQ